MIYLDLFQSVLVFLATQVGLSLVFASYLRGAELERFSLGLGLTLFLLFGVFFFFYQTGLPLSCLKLAPVFSLLLWLLRYRHIQKDLQCPNLRTGLLLYVFLAGWTLCCLGFIETYNGGMWAGDWVEHYERAQFFLKPLPLDYSFIGLYSFTARPPMGNALYAFFMALTSGDFAHFQLFCTLLNLLVLFPALLLVKQFKPGRTTASAGWVLVVFLMANPMFMQNSLYAWTRLLCAFFILLAVHEFLRAREDVDPFQRNALAFAMLAVALLVHYSAGPYVVACLCVYFITARSRFREPRFWKETALIGAFSSLILSVWFAWAVSIYGFSGTFLSNTAVTDVKDYTFLENAGKGIEEPI